MAATPVFFWLVFFRCCDSLRCTDCDFCISMFDNYQWHSSTDYLFLRNNMPDYERLKSKLYSSKGKLINSGV